MEQGKTRDWSLDANKIMMKQLELLQEETKKEETTANEKVEISKAMVHVYKIVVGSD